MEMREGKIEDRVIAEPAGRVNITTPTMLLRVMRKRGSGGDSAEVTPVTKGLALHEPTLHAISGLHRRLYRSTGCF